MRNENINKIVEISISKEKVAESKLKNWKMFNQSPLFLSNTLAEMMEVGVVDLEMEYLEEIKQLDPRNKKWKSQGKLLDDVSKKVFNMSKYLIG